MNKIKSLPPHVINIMKNKATEPPFSGEYNDFRGKGTYLCRQCGFALFRSTTKFHSACGWPSFDEEVHSHVVYVPDADGLRTEILCARCKGHLGHAFYNEGFTVKNLRHCVNSLSLDFISATTILDTEEAIFAGGCFWGVEYFFKKLPGVLKAEVGYSGGHTEYPSYEAICKGYSGHKEIVRVIFDPTVITYEALVKYFFQIHDPTQTHGQGPDIGEQYESFIFYYDEAQKKVAQDVIVQLEKKGYLVATQLNEVMTVWCAESYHQQYYEKNHKQPYCHFFIDRFK